ncbi:MAG: PadR family transcriptional regulator [Candidatus Thermoplasmatota archaeon]|jgi:DNA-binding PadR family transcriptional regulator|nr:PadR family transcriptional regulator [Candidatus Thermoplasmatota archaeon]MCL5789046.1 PadR family transcriptional regulator [Candidatus Thermoplasmatota archaeon]
MKEDGRERTFKGIISLVILKCLWNESGYGYQLEKEIDRCIGQKLSNGEVYSILKNMEIRGLIRNVPKPETTGKRKYYEISLEGKEYLKNQVKNMEFAINSFQEIIKFVNSVQDKTTEG